MEQHLCVLLYSKYSPKSQQLLSALESCPVDLSKLVGLTTVCVDNEDVRERILSETMIEISSLPCVLVVYRAGGIEKYEGSRAFQWVEETTLKYIPKEVEPVRVEPVRVEPVRPKDGEYIEENTREERRRTRMRTSRKKRVKSRHRRKHKVYENSASSESTSSESPNMNENKTLIEDLDTESSDDENRPQRPPAGVRTGPNSYDIVAEFGVTEEINRDMSKHTRSSTQPATGQGNDLMATAMAMQKERETEAGKKPRAVGSVQTNQRPI